MVQDVVVEVENSGTLFCKAFFGCYLFLPLFLSFLFSFLGPTWKNIPSTSEAQIWEGVVESAETLDFDR